MSYEITKAQFQSYEKVRVSGATNMWDTAMVSYLSDGVLSSDDAMEIIKQYGTLAKLYLEGSKGE